MGAWPADDAALVEEQRRLARLADDTPLWRHEALEEPTIAGTFFASSTGRRPSDRVWVAAVALRGRATIASSLVVEEVTAPYVSGLLALREGPLLEAALRALGMQPDVVLVDASGRDHPRGAGLALHLGAVLGVPTVGVTDRALVATPEGEPGPERGAQVPLRLEGRVVGSVVRTRRGARPVAVHAAWRTDAETAREIVMAASGSSRTPEPIRRARHAARVARARDEGRLPGGWQDRPLSR